MKKLLLLTILALPQPASAKNPYQYHWFSAPLSIGKSKGQELYVAELFSSSLPDGEQYIFLDYGNPTPYEDVAGATALSFAMACNKTHDYSCLKGQQGWVGRYGMLEDFLPEEGK